MCNADPRPRLCCEVRATPLNVSGAASLLEELDGSCTVAARSRLSWAGGTGVAAVADRGPMPDYF